VRAGGGGRAALAIKKRRCDKLGFALQAHLYTDFILSVYLAAAFTTLTCLGVNGCARTSLYLS
jgi:hypothetical protein